MRKRKKNINQTDLFDLVERLEQLDLVNLELNMTEALNPMELNLGDAPRWMQVSIDALVSFDG
ncbi:MAG: hypothetical protein QX198_02160 [Methylococcaceae bacterium]